MAENEVRKTKFEILIDVMKALGTSSFDLHEIEKYLRKIDAKADKNGTYGKSDCKSVVDHFKLEKEIGKSDKARIAELRRTVKELREQNKRLTAELVILNSIRENVKSIKADLSKRSDDTKQTSSNYEEPTYTDIADVQTDNYSNEPTNMTVESSSQQ